MRSVLALVSVTAIVVSLGAVLAVPRIDPPPGAQPKVLPAVIPTANEQAWYGRMAYAVETADGLTIHVLVAGSGQPQALIPGHSPAWSPDGTQITFVSERTGTAQVFLIGATGQSLTQLTHSPGAKSAPTWSPKGEAIAFLTHAGEETVLQLVDALGTTTSGSFGSTSAIS